jgi:hypothetical protein
VIFDECLKGAADLSAGMGDAFSWGATAAARKWVCECDTVDYGSKLYIGGAIATVPISIALDGAAIPPKSAIGRGFKAAFGSNRYVRLGSYQGKYRLAVGGAAGKGSAAHLFFDMPPYEALEHFVTELEKQTPWK